MNGISVLSKCVVCHKDLTTGDFNGICQSCRQQGHSEFITTDYVGKPIAKLDGTVLHIYRELRLNGADMEERIIEVDIAPILPQLKELLK